MENRAASTRIFGKKIRAFLVLLFVVFGAIYSFAANTSINVEDLVEEDYNTLFTKIEKLLRDAKPGSASAVELFDNGGLAKILSYVDIRHRDGFIRKINSVIKSWAEANKIQLPNYTPPNLATILFNAEFPGQHFITVYPRRVLQFGDGDPQTQAVRAEIAAFVASLKVVNDKKVEPPPNRPEYYYSNLAESSAEVVSLRANLKFYESRLSRLLGEQEKLDQLEKTGQNVDAQRKALGASIGTAQFKVAGYASDVEKKRNDLITEYKLSDTPPPVKAKSNEDAQVNRLNALLQRSGEIRDRLLHDYWNQFKLAPQAIVLELAGEGGVSAAKATEPDFADPNVRERITLRINDNGTEDLFLRMPDGSLKRIVCGRRPDKRVLTLSDFTGRGDNKYRELAESSQHVPTFSEPALRRETLSHEEINISAVQRMLVEMRESARRHKLTPKVFLETVKRISSMLDDPNRFLKDARYTAQQRLRERDDKKEIMYVEGQLLDALADHPTMWEERDRAAAHSESEAPQLLRLASLAANPRQPFDENLNLRRYSATDGAPLRSNGGRFRSDRSSGMNPKKGFPLTPGTETKIPTVFLLPDFDNAFETSHRQVVLAPEQAPAFSLEWSHVASQRIGDRVVQPLPVPPGYEIANVSALRDGGYFNEVAFNVHQDSSRASAYIEMKPETASVAQLYTYTIQYRKIPPKSEQAPKRIAVNKAAIGLLAQRLSDANFAAFVPELTKLANSSRDVSLEDIDAAIASHLSTNTDVDHVYQNGTDSFNDLSIDGSDSKGGFTGNASFTAHFIERVHNFLLSRSPDQSLHSRRRIALNRGPATKADSLYMSGRPVATSEILMPAPSLVNVVASDSGGGIYHIGDLALREQGRGEELPQHVPLRETTQLRKAGVGVEQNPKNSLVKAAGKKLRVPLTIAAAVAIITGAVHYGPELPDLPNWIPSLHFPAGKGSAQKDGPRELVNRGDSEPTTEGLSADGQGVHETNGFSLNRPVSESNSFFAMGPLDNFLHDAIVVGDSVKTPPVNDRDLVMRSLVDLKTEKGVISIPTPGRSTLRAIEVKDSSGAAVPGSAYDVVFDSATSTYAVKFKKSGTYKFSYGFDDQRQHEGAEGNPKIEKMSRARLRPIVENIRKAGFTEMANAFDRALADTSTLSYREVAAISGNSSFYTQAKATHEIGELAHDAKSNRYMAYRGYLTHGYLCADCDVENGMTSLIFEDYFHNDPGVKVRLITGLSLDESGRWVIIDPLHAIMELSVDGKIARADATASREAEGALKEALIARDRERKERDGETPKKHESNGGDKKRDPPPPEKIIGRREDTETKVVSGDGDDEVEPPVGETKQHTEKKAKETPEPPDALETEILKELGIEVKKADVTPKGPSFKTLYAQGVDAEATAARAALLNYAESFAAFRKYLRANKLEPVLLNHIRGTDKTDPVTKLYRLSSVLNAFATGEIGWSEMQKTFQKIFPDAPLDNVAQLSQRIREQADAIQKFLGDIDKNPRLKNGRPVYQGDLMHTEFPRLLASVRELGGKVRATGWIALSHANTGEMVPKDARIPLKGWQLEAIKGSAARCKAALHL